MNRYKPHVYLVPEDDCDRQLADGFVLHDQVNAPQVKVLPPPGGWGEVLKTFQKEYVKNLREYPQGHVVMIIDYDGDYVDRRDIFEKAIPDDLRLRVFVIGAIHTPEDLKKALGRNLERIGEDLAEECFSGSDVLWTHEQLKHNDPDRDRLMQIVRPILFGR